MEIPPMTSSAMTTNVTIVVVFILVIEININVVKFVQVNMTDVPTHHHWFNEVGTSAVGESSNNNNAEKSFTLLLAEIAQAATECLMSMNFQPHLVCS